MKILNEFDAVRYGTYSEFKSFYSGDVNVMNKYVNLNLLSLSMVNDINEEEKLKKAKESLRTGLKSKMKWVKLLPVQKVNILRLMSFLNLSKTFACFPTENN